MSEKEREKEERNNRIETTDHKVPIFCYEDLWSFKERKNQVVLLC
jgi:hypothetical protein